MRKGSEKDWSKLAENFDRLQRYVAGAYSTETLLSKIGSLRELGRVLEFGCGNGTFTGPLAGQACQVVATDCSEYMVRAATKRLAAFPNVQVEAGNCYQVEYPNESFDTVFMANLIHVVEQPEKAIQEAFRLLKKGGRLVLASFTMDGMKRFHIFTMAYRYLKTFGPPPKKGTPFRLQTLCDFLKQFELSIEQAELVGYPTKAMVVVARK